MTKLRRLLPRLLLESFFIVLSVLLALAANNWREDHACRARASQARSAFRNEIAANRHFLASEHIIGHHRKLQKTYLAAMTAGATDPGALFDTGLHPASLSEAAWRSFSNADIFSDFSARDVLLLSEIYRAQTDLQQHDAEFLNALDAPRADRETPSYQRDSARAIAMFLNDLMPLENTCFTPTTKLSHNSRLSLRPRTKSICRSRFQMLSASYPLTHEHPRVSSEGVAAEIWRGDADGTRR